MKNFNDKVEISSEFKSLSDMDNKKTKQTFTKSKKKTNTKKQYKKQKNEKKETSEQIMKSVFFHGNPSGPRLVKLREGQKLYNEKINFYISVLESDITYYLDLLNNNKNSDRIKSLEKELRDDMNSAYSQNAMDHAVTEMHNYITRIKNALYGKTMDTDENLFVANISLFNCCLLKLNFDETCEYIQNLIDSISQDVEEIKNSTDEDEKSSSKGKKSNAKRYEEMLAKIKTMGKEKVEESMNKVISLYEEMKSDRKIPRINDAPVQLDSRIFVLKENKDGYEVSISSINDSHKQAKDIGVFHYETKPKKFKIKDRQKLEKERADLKKYKDKVKINKKKNIKTKKFKSVKKVKIKDTSLKTVVYVVASNNSIRRINQYEMSKSGKYKILDNGILEVTIPFTKKVIRKSKEDIFIGGDVGINTLISTSNDKAFGTYSDMDDIYESLVIPELKKLDELRKAIEKHRKKLEDPTVTDEEKDNIRKKIHNINHMIQTNKSLKKALNIYKHEQDIRISKAVNDFFDLVKENDATAVIEELDIREFNLSKKQNRRTSSWVRGQLTEKIVNKLNWHGYKVIEVDPAYTSQVCPVCFYLDTNNRENKKFKCLCCGHSDDADKNAGVNIKERAKDKKLLEIISKSKYNRYKRHEAIKAYYDEKNTRWCKENNITQPKKSEVNKKSQKKAISENKNESNVNNKD